MKTHSPPAHVKKTPIKKHVLTPKIKAKSEQDLLENFADLDTRDDDRLPTMASYSGDSNEADTEDDRHEGQPGEDITNDYDYESEQDIGRPRDH